MNITVFASGAGSNFQALLDQQQQGNLNVHFVACISNNSTSQALLRAKEHHIPTHHISNTHFDSTQAYTHKLLHILTESNTDLIILAGYMKMIPLEIIQHYSHRIINIHPALLPAFGGQGMYGMNVHRAAIAYGVKLSGITIHFVDEEYDRGAIIYQETTPVRDGFSAEDLAQAVLALEHNSLWRVVKALSEKEIFYNGSQVCGTLSPL